MAAIISVRPLCARWSGKNPRLPTIMPNVIGRDLPLFILLPFVVRSEEHTSELQSLRHLVCRLLLEKKKRLHPNGLGNRYDWVCRNLQGHAYPLSVFFFFKETGAHGDPPSSPTRRSSN